MCLGRPEGKARQGWACLGARDSEQIEYAGGMSGNMRGLPLGGTAPCPETYDRGKDDGSPVHQILRISRVDRSLHEIERGSRNFAGEPQT